MLRAVVAQEAWQGRVREGTDFKSALSGRLVEKGKSKKLALIAVANKLLKQAFAIVKSGLKYDEKHISKLA